MPVSTTAGAWHYWNNTSTSTTITSTSNNYIWTSWTTGTSTGTTNSIITVANNTWVDWIIQDERTIHNRRHRGAPAVITADERERHERERRYWEERAREANARAAEEAKKREAAEKRAEELLMSVLSEEQRQTFKKDGHFIVRRGDRRYRIRRGWSGNVDVIDRDGRLSHRMCIHPRENVPICDNLVAQKLMLEACEDHMISVANKHPIWESERRPILAPLQ
jgi:hypothetical protein